MSTPTYGVEKIGLVRAESSYNTSIAFQTSSDFGFTALEIKPTLDFKEIVEHVGTASLQGEHKGKKGGEWSAEGYIKTHGSATAPDYGPFLAAAGMTFSGGIYGLSASQPGSLQIARKAGTSLYEIANGCWVSRLEFEAQGNAAAMWRASGGFASYGALMGVPVTDATSYLSSDTTITLSTASAFKIIPGVYVAFGSESNAGAGYLVTDVAANGVDITISPGLAGGISGSQTVTPIVPSTSVSGTVLGGVEDSLEVDSTALGFIMGKIGIDTGIHGLSRESNAAAPNRLARGQRRVTFEGEFYYLDENVHILGGAHEGVLRSLALTIGAATGSPVLTLPKARVAVSSVDIPDAEEATYKITAVARQNSAAEDEFTYDTN